jgi:hypothetical protein
LNIYVFGQVSLLLKLEDSTLAAVDVNTLQATNSAGWSQLSFNITQAGNYIDLNQINNLFFFPAPGDSTASGTIYFDGLLLCP